MPRGSWSFLHEWVIYEYLWDRSLERTLRLKLKVKEGKLQRREKWFQVINMKPISGTGFPPIYELSGQYCPIYSFEFLSA